MSVKDIRAKCRSFCGTRCRAASLARKDVVLINHTVKKRCRVHPPYLPAIVLILNEKRRSESRGRETSKTPSWQRMNGRLALGIRIMFHKGQLPLHSRALQLSSVLRCFGAFVCREKATNQEEESSVRRARIILSRIQPHGPRLHAVNDPMAT